VVAVYPDMGGARFAIEALEEAGIDGAAISLDGPAAQEAAVPYVTE
jgi:hypothetical protein